MAHFAQLKIRNSAARKRMDAARDAAVEEMQSKIPPRNASGLLPLILRSMKFAWIVFCELPR
jgi:hypothetical protein